MECDKDIRKLIDVFEDKMAISKVKEIFKEKNINLKEKGYKNKKKKDEEMIVEKEETKEVSDSDEEENL